MLVIANQSRHTLKWTTICTESIMSMSMVYLYQQVATTFPESQIGYRLIIKRVWLNVTMSSGLLHCQRVNLFINWQPDWSALISRDMHVWWDHLSKYSRQQKRSALSRSNAAAWELWKPIRRNRPLCQCTRWSDQYCDAGQNTVESTSSNYLTAITYRGNFQTTLTPREPLTWKYRNFHLISDGYIKVSTVIIT